MSTKKSIIAAAVGSAFAATLVTAPVAFAADNPFSVQFLEEGYMVADVHKDGDKNRGEGKYGESKCGANMADANKDGKVTKEEWDKHSEAMFEKMDTNKDGVIDKEEMKKAKEEKRKMHGDKKGY